MEYSARKTMALMGTKHFKRTFLGNPSTEVMKQQLFSLINSFKLQTMLAEEVELWIHKLVSLHEQMKNRHLDDLINDVETTLKNNILLQADENENIRLALQKIISPHEWNDCECTENKV